MSFIRVSQPPYRERSVGSSFSNFIRLQEFKYMQITFILLENKQVLYEGHA
jgi:hypothetical protein